MYTSSKKNIANFFWHGDNITIYELACLNSFLKNGFKVVVYSFKKLKLPKKIINKDANKILKKNEYKKFIHGGKKNCLAAYADKFRILLQQKKLGWWFDMDIICLKNSKEFSKIENKKNIVIGYETKKKVNNAVLKINDEKLSNEILNEINIKGYKFSWGAIGPSLLNNFLKKKKITSEILPENIFYPINYKKFYYFFLPNKASKAQNLTKKSLTIHLYNQIINRFGIPKNILPPKKSFLYKKMISYCPEFKKFQSIEHKTIINLINKKNGFKDNLTDLIPSFLRALKRF